MIDIKCTLRAACPTLTQRGGRIPFAEIARSILGASYELSLVICGDALARRMNIEYRQKSYFPNVLSFPLTKTEGEIFLNIRKAEREAHQGAMPVRERIAYLFVHGCFHLKGLDHSDTMEREEVRIMRKFGLGS